MRLDTSLIKTWQVVTACVMLICTAMPSYAAIQMMNVVGVAVHKRNDVAEDLAIDYAKKRAVYMLVEKWQVPDAANRVASLSPQVFEQAVRGAEVLKLARDGDVLYANVQVSIQDIPLRRALGLPLEETEETTEDVDRRGILVIPVWRPDEDVSPVVWGRRNPLIAPIKPLLLRHGRGALVLPVGDRQDRSELDYDNALNVNFESLAVLIKRYGAVEVLQAIVTPGAPETDAPTRILMHRMRPGESRPEIVELAAGKEATIQARVASAADAIARYAAGMSTATAEAQRESWEKLPKKAMQLNFTTMQEYGRLEAMLRDAPGAGHVAFADIRLQSVNATLYSNANDDALRRYFEKNGVRFQQTPTTWILSYR